MGPKRNPVKQRISKRQTTSASHLRCRSRIPSAAIQDEVTCGTRLAHVLWELNIHIQNLALAVEEISQSLLVSSTDGVVPDLPKSDVARPPVPSQPGNDRSHKDPASLSLAIQTLNDGIHQLGQFSFGDLESLGIVRHLTEKSSLEHHHLSLPAPKQKKKSPSQRTSSHFEVDPFCREPTPKGLCFQLQECGYGLIQERIRGSLFALIVQAILWNQTSGKAGRPVLFQLLTLYPNPETLAQADPSDLLPLIGKLGLQKIRSDRLVKMAKVWVDSPPHPSRRYGKKHYPNPGDNTDTRDGELLDMHDIRAGWEIAHLPGVGAYALDSYRIFYRDTLRGIQPGDGHEPEWKRVLPLDKDLRPYLVWKWAQEGWVWDPITGHRERATAG